MGRGWVVGWWVLGFVGCWVVGWWSKQDAILTVTAPTPPTQRAASDSPTAEQANYLITQPSMRIGAHMSIAGGVANAIARAQLHGCEALQIFSKNGNQWVGKA